MAKMNSLSLYVTTNQIILKADPNNSTTWQDLYRLLPYLRNSLSCVVCSNLLVDPQSPTGGRCNHHICKKCKGGRKKIKPACTGCRYCLEYYENKSLKILLQCYQQMCQHLTQSPIYAGLLEQASIISPVQSVERGAGNLLALIREGSEFHDDYQSEGGIPKSTYNILPCVYTNSSTQTLQVTPVENNSVPLAQNVLNIVNSSNTSNIPSRPNIGSNLYSVMYPGAINKITIKRKPNELNDMKQKIIPLMKKDPVEKVSVFKKPVNKCVVQSKKGCRCGNATATPGKLTCCGQRCPCYVESKACIECRCRGCRNPHRPDGLKVRPMIPDIHSYQVNTTTQLSEPQIIHNQPIKLGSVDVDPHFTFDPIGLKTYKVVAGGFNSLSIPTTLLMNTPILEEDINLEG
ncbi:E3 ubiquitin-protein ligase MSL2 [Harmonia axyridis]|uniref:E3 ubiquitin-protein ligase MSL2 n=1 Tax=Harmonia axyridis TaxID=115357 RepID=UPI001E2752CE|nr:E3 ubiquitin-protein ligase MSL2 [Harmonia axyridis]